MTGKFGDLLEESEIARIPAKMRKFLRRREPDSYTRTWEYFSHSYSIGFEELARGALEAFPRKEYLYVPAFFLARHSIELSLKSTILEYVKTDGTPPNLIGHSLIKLWTQLLEYIQRWDTAADDEWSIYCGKLIAHLDEFDPDGERFRYPTALTGKQFDFTEVELKGLKHAHLHLTTYCGACIDMHSET